MPGKEERQSESDKKIWVREVEQCVGFTLPFGGKLGTIDIYYARDMRIKDRAFSTFACVKKKRNGKLLLIP